MQPILVSCKAPFRSNLRKKHCSGVSAVPLNFTNMVTSYRQVVSKSRLVEMTQPFLHLFYKAINFTFILNVKERFLSAEAIYNRPLLSLRPSPYLTHLGPSHHTQHTPHFRFFFTLFEFTKYGRVD